jgi:serine/threonine protein kinase
MHCLSCDVVSPCNKTEVASLIVSRQRVVSENVGKEVVLSRSTCALVTVPMTQVHFPLQIHKVLCDLATDIESLFTTKLVSLRNALKLKRCSQTFTAHMPSRDGVESRAISLKCRFEKVEGDDQEQIIVKVYRTAGSQKKIFLTTRLSGPELEFEKKVGSVFIEVKPLIAAEVGPGGDGKLAQQMLRDECSLLAEIEEHRVPNTVTIIPVHKRKNGSELKSGVMKWYEGGTLHELVSEKSSAICAEDILRYARNLASAIAGLEALNIVHCDLKPENIFLGMVKGVFEAFVGDFGLAHKVFKGFTEPQGSKLYFSPEAILCSTVIHPKRDVWALGLLFLALKYREPNGYTRRMGENVEEILRRKVSSCLLIRKIAVEECSKLDAKSPFDQLIIKMLTLDPFLRPKASDVLKSLESMSVADI